MEIGPKTPPRPSVEKIHTFYFFFFEGFPNTKLKPSRFIIKSLYCLFLGKDLYFSGFIKAVWSEDPTVDDESVPVKDAGPITSWWNAGYDGGKNDCEVS